MTIPICVNRNLLRIKSTTKQENNRTLKRTVFLINMFRPKPRGSATVHAHFLLNSVYISNGVEGKLFSLSANNITTKKESLATDLFEWLNFEQSFF